MSKQSKSKRDQKRKRRERSVAARAHTLRQSPPERDWTVWLWAGSITVAVLVVGGLLWLAFGRGRGAETPVEPANPVERDGIYTAPPEMQIDPGKTYVATLETKKGDMTIQLYADKAPITVNNFVFLARAGFYDGTTFHRVLPGFMAQGGDPTGTGSGGPGYRFPDEFHADLKHDSAGVLSMVNSGANSNGSQFFIIYEPTPWLDAYDEDGNLKDCERADVSCHAVFGRVIDGMEVLESLTPRDPSRNPAVPGDLVEKISIDER